MGDGKGCEYMHEAYLALGICTWLPKSYLLGGSDGEESACNAGDLGWEDPLEPWSGCPLLEYSCLENSMERSLVGYSP